MPEWEYFDRPATAVESNLGAMNQRADEALAAANQAISALGNFSIGVVPNPPGLVMPTDLDVPPVVEPRAPEIKNFGHVHTPSVPAFEDLSQLLGLNLSDVDINIPPFNPTTGAIQMPPTPGPIDTSGMPSRPTVTDPTLPSEPSFVLPSLQNLTQLQIPEFVFPDLPLFNETAPTFGEARPSTTIIWTEPEYDSQLLDDVVARVREWLQGGTGLPLAIQQALFDRARTREQQTALDAQQAAFDAFAGRNFSMPPGMLVEQLNVAIEKSRMAQNTLEREILIESAKWEIENIRHAVAQGVALETVLIQKFMAMAQRVFEAAKFSVESEINVFNAMVSLFNARQQGYRTAAEVFKIRIEGELAKLEVFKAEIEGEIAKGQLNEQKVREYEARVRGLMAIIEVYKTRMDGARIQSEIARNKIEAYRTDVQAYGEKLDAEKKRFDAYEAQVRAEAAKAGAFEAEARAYAETVRAAGERANVKIRFIEGKISAIRAGIEKFTALLEVERARVQASLGEVEAKARAYTADVARYQAEIEGETESVRTTLQVAEARLRNNIAYFEAQMKEYDANITRIVESAKIVVGALDAAARSASALAQGAMSAIHVQASMSGQGQVSDSQSYNVHINRRGADVA